jgi:hypothetical protein
VCGELTVTYTCPRCGYINQIKIDASKLLYGMEMNCANTEVCGEREMRFEFTLEAQMRSYKGLTDVPLHKGDENG